jgi:uncharacterized membrane-anchored protein
MLDPDRYRPKFTPLDVWRVGASIIFILFGLSFVLAFLSGRVGGPLHAWIGRIIPLPLFRAERPSWSVLLFGVLILLYGVYRVWSGLHNWRRLTQEPQDRVSIEPHHEEKL